MQLFGLVNTLLANDNDTAKKDLRIHGYSVRLAVFSLICP